MRPITILHVTETAKGGIGTCIGLFASFDPAHIRSYVVAPEQHASHLNRDLNVTTFDRPSRGTAAVYQMIRTAHQLAREVSPDVILCHSTFSLSVAAWFRIVFPGRPVIFCPNGLAIVRYEEGTWKHRIARLVEGLAYRIPNMIVHVSKAEEALASRCQYPGRHLLIENAMPDLAQPARADLFAETRAEGKINLLFVGRLDRQKGFDVLAEAVRCMAGSRPDILIHVVGESVNKDTKLDALPENFVMHGWVDHREIDNWYRSADALIVPSRWEGLPFVVVEALRSGTPALVSDRAGMPDIIEAGRSGEVFPLKAAAIADMLEKLDGDELSAMRPAARAAYEERFAVERFLGQYRDLLYSVLPSETRQTQDRSCA